MGTSYVAYKGFGFWSRDAFLESWLKTLLTEMGTLSARQPWQDDLMKYWSIQSQVDGGVMSLGLDEFLTDVPREEFVLRTAKQALRHSEPAARRTAELFIRLLEGKLTTTVRSPIDYLS